MNPNNMNPVMPSIAPEPAMNSVPIKNDDNENKSSTVLSILSVVAACIVAAIAIFIAVQKQLSYQSLKNNIEVEKQMAVNQAKEAQAKTDRVNQDKKLAVETKSFTGPSDMGTINFYYPKKWNAYISDSGASGNSYLAVFSDGKIPPIKDSESRYALVFSIENTDINTLIKKYDAMSKNGLTGQIFNKGNIFGKRYDGYLGEGRDQASFVVFGIGNSGKSAVLRCDLPEYKNDFEKIIDSLTRVAN